MKVKYKLRDGFTGPALVMMLIFAILLAGPAVAEEPELDLDEEIAEHATMDNLESIMNIIQNYYVDEVSQEELIKSAIEGMLQEIDRYSNYMTEEEYLDMQEEMEGEYGGIGIIITMRDNELTIVSPISGTPGDDAGLQAEDVIVAIDGDSTEDMTQQQAVDRMRGEPGTDVTITIERGEEQFDVDITRAQIDIPIVEGEKLEDGRIGYIEISQFLQETADKLSETIAEMERDGVEALIIDLRNNPGGILQESVEVSSVFAGEGDVLSIRQRNGEEQVFPVNPGRMTTDLPVLVLVNRGSASASEIVAGFIRDTDRGKLLGGRTFGKGTVQSVFPMEDGSALRMTTARYYTTGENMIDEEGIEPDYVVEYEDDPIEEEDLQLDKALLAVEYYLDHGEWPRPEDISIEGEMAEETAEDEIDQ